MGYVAIMLIGVISGFLPLLPMLAFFHFMMLKQDKKSNTKTAVWHIAAVYLFCAALVSVLSVTGIPGIYHMSVNMKFNFTPFAGVSGYFHEYGLNVLLFIPVGFLLPMLWKKFEKMHITILWGFFFSLSIEIIQLFNNRITDIDDLTANTAGTVTGYFLFLLARKIFPKLSVFAIDRANAWKWEPYLCFCFVWISMLVFSSLIAMQLLGGVMIRQ